jgi:hypothetical protein
MLVQINLSIYEMKNSIFLTLLTTLSLATAHTVFTTLFVDDVSQGDGTCVRMPHDPATATDPVNDLTSEDMACGK